MPITLNGTTGISTPNLDSAGTVTTTNLVNGTALAFRNKIINGNFDIWQRGASITGSGGEIYSSDRWVSYGGGTGFSNVINSRQTFTIGQTEVPNNPKYFFRYNSNGTGVTSQSVAQRIEGVNTLAGKNITVSFWTKSSTNITASTPLRLRQNFGTGGSPSSQVLTTIASNLNLTTSWQKFSFATTLPSVSGKTIGSNSDDYLELVIPTGEDNINATVDIAQVQLEEGSVATPFELRPIGTELALCQRYYEKSYDVDVAPGAVNSYRGSTYEIQAVYTINPFGGALLKATFKQTKRTSAPTITVHNPNNGTVNQLSIWDSGTTWDRNVAISTPIADHTRALIWPTAGTTVNSGHICIAHWAVDAEL